MSHRDAVLFANEAFYLAFNGRDFAAMDALWAQDAPVSCIHPGGGPIFDREAVMASWKSILGHDSSAAIRFHAPRVRMLGEHAVVVCFEEIAGNTLIATNVFAREGRAWRMVHHQAGPTAETPPRAAGGDEGPVRFN